MISGSHVQAEIHEQLYFAALAVSKRVTCKFCAVTLACSLKMHPMNVAVVTQLVQASSLVKWEQLYPLMRGMAHEAIQSEDKRDMQPTLAAIEALHLLSGRIHPAANIQCFRSIFISSLVHAKPQLRPLVFSMSNSMVNFMLYIYITSYVSPAS